MKKILIIMLVCMLVLTGCGKKDETKSGDEKSYLNEPQKETICFSTFYSSEQDYRVNNDVTLYSRGGAVLSEKDVDVFKSINEELRNKYIERTKNEFERQNQSYGGTTYVIQINDEKVNVEANIDYSKYNMKQFMEDYGFTEKDMIDGYVSLDSLIALYEYFGYTCNKQ